MIDTQDEHIFTVDTLLDNELNKRDYDVNCIRCGQKLTVWYKCPYCHLITFCDCHPRPMCDCSNSRTVIRSVVEDMKQLYRSYICTSS